MTDMGGDQIEEAVASCAALLRAAAGRDWDGVRAGRLEWSCRRTAEHIASDLIAYAGQLAGRAGTAYVPFGITVDEGTGDAGVVDVIETTGALLAAAVRTTPREVRAFHPYPFRSANREGFAAMGVAEVLLHTHDIAEGLGLPYEPPAELCARVLTTIFPHVRPEPDAPWNTLLWATGRGDLPGREPLTEWRWNNNLVIDTERLTLEGVTPAAAADLHTGGTGGFEWVEGGPFEGTRDASGMAVSAYEKGLHRPEWGYSCSCGARTGGRSARWASTARPTRTSAPRSATTSRRTPGARGTPPRPCAPWPNTPSPATTSSSCSPPSTGTTPPPNAWSPAPDSPA